VKPYNITFVDRDGLDYSDEDGVYHFGVRFIGRQWTVYMPITKGPFLEAHELTDEEISRIFPRIKSHLESKRTLGFFGRRYPVTFETLSISQEMRDLQKKATEYLKRTARKTDSKT
jgi:hypothetical protein